MEKTLGGDRLGSGKKMKVHLHGYERSSHDIGYIWRSTMAAGTLVPFMCELGTRGTTFDINLDCDVKTHPTIGPLFGSYKVQLDIFTAPIRLYQGLLHNNALGIGLKMSSVKLPQMNLYIDPALDLATVPDVDNCQINPSCVLSYLGIRGVGKPFGGGAEIDNYRNFNAIPLLMLWDTYKNYYANKQEGIGYVMHTAVQTPGATPSSITFGGSAAPTAITGYETIVVTYAGTLKPAQIIIQTTVGTFSLYEIGALVSDTGTVATYTWQYYRTGNCTVTSWALEAVPDPIPGISYFELSTIDDMRNSILAQVASTTPVIINDEAAGDSPYDYLLNKTYAQYLASQEGLPIKTYQSDLLNNWLSTEWIDGVDGINAITAVDTSGGSFTMDTLQLARKVYDMLNRIAVSGGSYDDWQDAVYEDGKYTNCTTPIYNGGLIKELIFQEVVSNAESAGDTGGQPLGTLAGKGTMGKKHKGGTVRIRLDEASYVMGIISLTPRIDNSQGNKWDTTLLTMDDIHKPALDAIGFQESINEARAWWSTEQTAAGVNDWAQTSAGKQPAWINYMTNINKVYGNFAIATNEMFMTLNRRYEYNAGSGGIQDLTTYIDPAKYNNIFAQTSLDSQNFWVQIAVDITARRKMSAKIMPNL